jgi:hypothetical protein
MSFRFNFASLAALALVSVLSLGGCKSSTQQAGNSPSSINPSGTPGSAASQAPPPPASVDLPAGARIRVRLDQDLGSKISRPGESFSATVAEDVVVNGQTVIARDSRADGTVIDAKALGHIKGGAYLSIRIDRVHTNWGSYPVETSSIDRAEKGKVRLEPSSVASRAAAKVRSLAQRPAAAQARPEARSPATSRSFCPPRRC